MTYGPQVNLLPRIILEGQPAPDAESVTFPDEWTCPACGEVIKWDEVVP